jgi:hypothetical protein
MPVHFLPHDQRGDRKYLKKFNIPQGPAKKVAEAREGKTNKKTEINKRPTRVWRKRKDPVSAAMTRKIEAVAMDRALKYPMHGGLRFLKPKR